MLEEYPPHWADKGYSDAAGGSRVERNHGVGIVKDGEWAVMEWSKLINSSEVAGCCGAMWRHKLHMLELAGHLLHISSFARQVQGRCVVTYIDNAAAVALAR